MANLEVDDLKPNRINFIESVEALLILIDPYIKEDHIEEIKKINEEEKNEVQSAKRKWRLAMTIMKQATLLPLEVVPWAKNWKGTK